MSSIKSVRSWNVIWDKLQSFFGFNGVDSPFSSGPLVIDEPLTLYVETWGNDSNPGTADRPYKTIQAALDYLKPFEIAAAVVISVGSGIFAGFALSGLRFGASGNITVEGGLVSNGGQATGSFSASGATLTVTDATKTWVANEHRGKIVRLRSGSTDTFVCVGGNGVNTLELTTSLTSSTGNVYELYDYGTFISSPHTANGLSSSVMFGPNFGAVVTPVVRRMRIIAAANVRIRHTNAQLTQMSSSQGCTISGSFSLALSSTHWDGAISPFALSSAQQVCGFISCTGSVFVTGYPIQLNAPTTVRLTSSRFIGNNSGVCLEATCRGAVFLILGTVEFSNNAIAINCQRGGQLITDPSAAFATMSGSNIGTAYSVQRGGMIQVASTSTLTGTTADVNADGAISTIAAMRANSPKIFPLTPNPYGSYVYE